MLETLVSSRIRRTLLEHLLTHSNEPFYLRGLAKELDLSVSPLRRELKRLEQSGMLTASQEGNMLFYSVNQGSPAFQQLKGAAPASPPVSAPVPPFVPTGSAPVGILNAEPAESRWHSPLGGPALVAATAVGLALMVVVVGLMAMTIIPRRALIDEVKRVEARAPSAAPAAASASSSGVMRGSRWQVAPGGMGGFSSGGQR